MPSNGGNKLNYGPLHTNSNVIAAMDIRVGGKDPLEADLLEICILPVNHSYKMHPEILPFMCKIRPCWPVDNKVAKLSNENRDEYTHSPFDMVDARTRFENWCIDTCRLKNNKRIIPLCWNYPAMRPWLKMWLESSYDELVEEDCVRDLQSLCAFYNDRADLWGEELLFRFNKFREMLNRLKVEKIDNNSLSSNCKAVIDCYQLFLRMRLPGYVQK